MERLDSISPVRVFLIVLAVVFVVELSIMVVMLAFEAPLEGGMLLSVADAMLLVVVLCPVLWLLVVRPLRASITQRGALLSRVLSVQEEERTRLARDLHDELGQLQTAILLGARSIGVASTLDEAQRRAEEVARMSSSAIDAARRLARGAAPGVLADLGLRVAVDRLCEDLSAADGVSIERIIGIGDRRFAPATEIAAYRMIQEALTNALRHARASRIRVAIGGDDSQLAIEVTDDGVGIPAAPSSAGSGMGLAGMRERVILLGGAFRVDSHPGRGTAVHAIIPLRSAGAAA